MRSVALAFCLLLIMSSFVSAFPDATNTGITAANCPNWASIKTNTSGRNLTVAGATIQNEEVSGPLTPKAANITIRCIKMNANGALYGINCFGNNCAGLQLRDSELYNVESSVVNFAAPVSNPIVALRLNIHNSVNDLVKIEGNTTLQDSYLHTFTPDPEAHNDVIQTSRGSNIALIGNRLVGQYRAQTSAYILKTDFAASNNILIWGNEMSGGTYTLYLYDGGFGVPTNVVVKNNTWLKGSYKFGPVSPGPPGSTINASHCFEWSGNVFDDATTLGAPGSTSPAGTCGNFPPPSGNASAQPPSFSPAPASFTDTVSVTLASSTGGATIYYTTNGATPTTGSTAYTVPIVIATTTTIKAIAVKSGLDNSAVSSGVYTITGECSF